MNDLKLIIKSLIISSPKTLTVRELENEFRNMEGYRIPYQKLGFSSTYQFLRSMNDFQVRGYDSNALVTCAVSENVSHIHKMVMEQKPPQKRRSRGGSRQRNRRNVSTNVPPPAPRRMHPRNMPTRGYKPNFTPIYEDDDGSNAVNRQTNNKNDFSTQKRSNQYGASTTDRSRQNFAGSNNYGRKNFNQNTSYQMRKPEHADREKVSERISRLSGNSVMQLKPRRTSDEKENTAVIKSDFIKNNNARVARTFETRRCLNEVNSSFSPVKIQPKEDTKSPYDNVTESEPNQSPEPLETDTETPLQTNNPLSTEEIQDSSKDVHIVVLDSAGSEVCKGDETKTEHENVMDSDKKNPPNTEETTLIELTHPTTAERCQEAIPDYALVESLFHIDRDEPIVDSRADFKESFMWYKLKKDSHIRIYVSEVHSPFKFWFQVFSTEDVFRRMCVRMQTFYFNEKYGKAYAFPKSCIVPGRICVAIFNNIWHRAKILNYAEGEKVKVFYVDFGTVGYVAISDLKYLTEEFCLLPKQAFRGSLINIEPIGNHWSQHATTHFVKSVFQRRLMGRIAELNETARTVYLMLYFEGKTRTILINNALVAQGHANPNYEWIQRKSLRRPHKRENLPSFELLESGQYPTFNELLGYMSKGFDYEAVVDRTIFSPDLLNSDRKCKELLKSLDFPLLATNPFCFEILSQLGSGSETNDK